VKNKHFPKLPSGIGIKKGLPGSDLKVKIQQSQIIPILFKNGIVVKNPSHSGGGI
jgi:hypothetical protein